MGTNEHKNMWTDRPEEQTLSDKEREAGDFMSDTKVYRDTYVKEFIKQILNKPKRITFKKWIKQKAGDKLI